MKQYTIKNNVLTLRVKKGSLVLRYIILLFAIICILLPTFGIIANAVSGGSIKFHFFIVLGLFGLLSFFMFRTYLWNTYGKEIIYFSEEKVTYIADYRYFRDTQQISRSNNISLSIASIGYEEDKMGVLCIKNKTSQEQVESIQCVTKMPQEQLKELITSIIVQKDLQ